MRLPLLDSTLAAVAACAARIDALGWAEAGAGNLSLLLPPAELARTIHGGEAFELGGPGLPRALPPGHLLAVSATGVTLRALADDPARHLALLGSDARGLFKVRGSAAPSSELACHLAVHARRARPGALVHAHTDFLIALSLLDALGAPGALETALVDLMPETQALLPGGVKRLALAPPGSASLGLATAAAMVDAGANAVIWPRHGALAAGDTLAQALGRLEILEKAARVWWLAHATGETPAPLARRLGL